MHVVKARVFGQGECGKCGDDIPRIGFEFAFQPIVSFKAQSIFAHEALARGAQGESADSVLGQLTPENRYRFDQECRTRAIEQAAALGMPESLSINFIPNGVANPRACIQRTLRAAANCGFALSRLIFEVTESEKVADPEMLVRIFREYRKLGIKTAIDDFGAGYAGLNLLARFQPDIVKIDIDLIRDVDSNKTKQIIVENIVSLCSKLNIVPLAEGVETFDERDFLLGIGIDLMQGFLFARPAFKAMSPVDPIAWSTR
ncbi:EAL domain-containing protein [Massilia forsythiae]|uniref:EAL domain-containing protein n=1 Tax=Massilia forsythiae TaxID=2728020 RepID=A0A7Z2ZUF5_9BURK|nr:EAL domain-containing protein [Massilia forsythiae]QJE02503.1 EAL domain-containing protein [Massilia forsythiae]